MPLRQRIEPRYFVAPGWGTKNCRHLVIERPGRCVAGCNQKRDAERIARLLEQSARR